MDSTIAGTVNQNRSVMDKNTQSSEGVASKSPLDLLEYVALIGSVAGSAAAIATQSIAYAATPLSLAVLVNFANRRRIDQLSLQNSRAARVQVQQISEQLQSVQNQLQISAGGASSAVMPDLQPLQANLGQLQQQYDGLQSSFADLSAYLQNYQERLTTLEQSPASTAASFMGEAADLEPIRSEIATLDSKIQQLAASGISAGSDMDSSAVESMMQEMQIQYASLQAALDGYGDRLTSLEQAPAAVVSGGESPELGQVRSHLEALEARLHSMTASTPETGIDASALENFKVEVQEQYASLQAALSGVSAQVQDASGGAAIANLESSVAQLSQTLTGFDQRLNGLEQTPAAATIAPAALETLQEQVQSLDQKWETTVGKLAGEVQSMPGQVEQIVQKKLEELAGEPAAKSSADLDELDSILSGL